MLAALLAGCGETKDTGATESLEDPPPTEPLELELGAGRTAFVELDADAPTLEIISGPQGGWHLEVTLRLSHYDEEPLVLDYQALDLEGRSLGFPAEYAVDVDRLLEVDGERFVRVGDRVVFDVPDPDLVRGLQIRVTCRASRGDQELAATEETVLLIDEVDELL